MLFDWLFMARLEFISEKQKNIFIVEIFSIINSLVKPRCFRLRNELKLLVIIFSIDITWLETTQDWLILSYYLVFVVYDKSEKVSLFLFVFRLWKMTTNNL